MRTNEKTYLQTLIADPDRKTDLHSLGCWYLYDDDIALKLAALVHEQKNQTLNITSKNLSKPIRPYDSRNFEFKPYVIGYLDLSLTYEDAEKKHFTHEICVEVKASKQNILDIIQQIKTYMIFCKQKEQHHSFYFTHFVLATMYPITSKLEKDMLAQEGIFHIWIDYEKARQYLDNKKQEAIQESF